MQVAQAGHHDPTVCSPAERKLIESHYGVSLSDAPSELLQFVVDRSKQAGNQAFKSKDYAGDSGSACARCGSCGGSRCLLGAPHAIRSNVRALTCRMLRRRGRQALHPGSRGERDRPHAVQQPIGGLPVPGALRQGHLGRPEVHHAAARVGQGLLSPGLRLADDVPVGGGRRLAAKVPRPGARGARRGASPPPAAQRPWAVQPRSLVVLPKAGQTRECPAPHRCPRRNASCATPGSAHSRTRRGAAPSQPLSRGSCCCVCAPRAPLTVA